MNGIQIERLLKTCPKSYFKGVYSADNLPKITRRIKPCGFVCNTDASTEPGTHWVAIYVPFQSAVEYFDSYGLPPFIENIYRQMPNEFIYNTRCLQNPYTSVCGQYAIYFIWQRMHGKSFDEIIKEFGRNTIENDERVNYRIEEIFHVDLNVYDNSFMHTQICRTFKDFRWKLPHAFTHFDDIVKK
jgi:hypothetical protein